MSRFLPKSLLGQTLLAVAVALLVAQTITSVLIHRVSEERRMDNLETAITGLIWAGPAFRRDRGEELLSGDQRRNRRSQGRRRANALRGEVTDTYPLLSTEVNDAEFAARIEKRLSGFMQIEPYQVLITERLIEDDPTISRRTQGFQKVARQMVLTQGRILVAAVQWDEDGAWHVVRLPNPRPHRTVIAVTAGQTSILFVILLGLLFLILRRITRPLAQLTERVSTFSQNPDHTVRIEESGPEDMRRLIAAHNTMETRIAALLDEKDVMLGAIGHDLKTPLAALRVRIESVPDETQREKMADSIEDLTRTLDDILSLARVGRNGGARETLDLSAMAIGVVEEFEDLGEPVTIKDSKRVVAKVQETWLKRALRNLTSNAVRYGGSAEIIVLEEDGAAILQVDDKGPGIPADQIEQMLEPFTRGEASRNRATGGAGLGLTLARAIAEQHGGTLTLTNREEGGLRAELRVPV